MREKLDQLEKRVAALVELAQRQADRAAALEEEKAELVARLNSAEDQIDALKKEKKALERRQADLGRQKEELGKQLSQGAPLEDEARERIRKIIERIERVEAEIAQGLKSAEESQ